MTLRKSRIVTRVAFAFVEQFGCSRQREREKEREKNSTHVIESGCNAIQCTCAIVKLGQGGLHGVLDSRSA